MLSFGERLRQEREARSVDLHEIAESTKIGSRYLQALETNDFDVLPGTVFAKGYVRAYAEYIGANAEALVDALVIEMDSQGGQEGDSAKAYLQTLESTSGQERARGGSSESRGWARKPFIIPVVVVAGLAVLALALYWGLSGSDSDVEATLADATRPAASPQAGSPNAKSPPAMPSGDAGTRADGESVDDAGEPSISTATTSSASTSPIEPEAVVRREPTVAGNDDSGSTPSDALAAKAVADARDQPAGEPAARAPDAADTTKAANDSRGDLSTAEPAETPSSKEASRVAESGADVDARISVPEFGVGTSVVNRKLTGESDRFNEGTRVTFWTRVVGGQSGERIRHVWLYKGAVMDSIELELGGSHWRTYSRKTLPRGKLGPWAVELRDAAGRVRARQEFSCSATGSSGGSSGASL
jgi:cytoskeletal protein RodZ